MIAFSIIIINYRQKEFTENCVRSLKQHLPADSYEIIVVNNSPEEEIIIDGIKIIENTNRGFPQANNLAADSAQGKYLFFLNADTLTGKDFTKAFSDNFSDKEFGAVGLGMKNPDETPQLSFWKENSFLNEMRNKKQEEEFRARDKKTLNKFKQNRGIMQVDWVSGAAMIIPRDIFAKLNGFDEEFFLFHEDADICKRIYITGMKVFYLPFDGLVHFKGENVNPEFKTDTYYHSKKSQILYYKKHNSIIQRIMLRIYLFSRFLFLSFKGKLYRRILKMVMGLEK